MKFIKKIFTSYYYVRAIACIQKEEDLTAYNYLKKIDIEIIEEYYKVQYYLYLGFTSLSLRKMHEAEASFNKAIIAINNDNKLKFNKDEKNYLKCYALCFLYSLNKYLDRNIDLFQNEIDKIKNLINIENVKEKLLTSFPLPR